MKQFDDFFKPQSLDQSRLKLALYGGPGSGKSWTAKLFADGLIAATGKMAVIIDTEDGYKAALAAKFPNYGILKKENGACDPKTVLEALETAIANPNVGIIVMDSVSQFWTQIFDDYLEVMKVHPKREVRERGESGRPGLHEWAIIKKPWRRLVEMLISCDKHVVSCFRAKAEYDMSEPDRVRTTGNITPKAEKDALYEFDVILEMEKHKEVVGTKEVLHHYAHIEKDRWNVIHGKTFESPDFGLIKPLLDRLAPTSVKAQTIGTPKPMATPSKGIELSPDFIEQMMADNEVKALFVQLETETGRKASDNARRTTIANHTTKEGLVKYLMSKSKKGTIEQKPQQEKVAQPF